MTGDAAARAGTGASHGALTRVVRGAVTGPEFGRRKEPR